MKIFAHRGASYLLPEMTREAYERGDEEGADGFECDLRLTRDGVGVLWHDKDMARIAGSDLIIAKSRYREIKEIYPSILTLEEFLIESQKMKKELLIETKHPVPSGNKVERYLIHTLKEKKVSIPVSLMSFSWKAIEMGHLLNRNLPSIYLLRSASQPFTFTSARTIGPGIDLVRSNPHIVSRIKKSGRKVSVWTVDNEEDILLCRELGVDNLITNMPAHAREVLGYS